MDMKLELALQNMTSVNTAIVVRESDTAIVVRESGGTAVVVRGSGGTAVVVRESDTSWEFVSLSSVCPKYCFFTHLSFILLLQIILNEMCLLTFTEYSLKMYYCSTADRSFSVYLQIMFRILWFTFSVPCTSLLDFLSQ
jgi:hypothetical protein